MNNEKTTDSAVVDFSMDTLADFFEKIFATLKKIFAWLGILILPDGDEKNDYTVG